jgi:DNA-binding NarL/FixJ family response regulator
VLARHPAAEPAWEDRPVRRTVLLVDDDEGFRRWAAEWLRSEGYAVVGQAGAAGTALSSVRRLRPEVVLVDVQLPDLDGFELTESLRAEPDPPAVVLISSRDAADYGDRIVASGAAGFISKEELTAEMIESVLQGAP